MDFKLNELGHPHTPYEEDPLLLTQSQTWPMWWRIAALVNVSFFNMMNNFFAAGIPPLFGLIIKEFHCTSQEVSQLSSYALLMLGVAVSHITVGLVTLSLM